VVAGPLHAAQPPDKALPGVAGDELDAAERAGTGTLFRLVVADKPAEGIGPRLFWRSIPAYVAAETCPVRIQVGGDDAIAPREAVEEGELGVRRTYPTQGRRELREGEHVLSPGNIPIEVKGGKVQSAHPAIQVAEGEVRIRCAPVRFDAVVGGASLPRVDGSPVPVALSVRYGQMPLLRQEGKFNPLIVWLPVGVRYSSTLGDFAVTPEGKVEGLSLAEGVAIVGNGLRLTVKPVGGASLPRAAAPGGTLWLVSHRGRSVFAEHEEATFAIIVSEGFTGGEAALTCGTAGLPSREGARKTRSGEPTVPQTMVLGKVALPAVEKTGFDSRLITIRMRDIPPGDYRLSVQAGEAKSESVPLTIVPWHSRSPFFVHTMSGCTSCWPTTDDGLAMLRNAGVEMGSCTGHTSILDTRMPKLDAEALKTLAGPAELALRPAPNDLLLERLLRHQIRLIDLTPLRGPGMYLETLSYHHSYKPSVDRMVRHMQVFTQQTADYPSFFGVNYSWFPALFGYAEGGVPCDAHVGDRNRALADAVAQAGFRNPTRDERKWYHENKLSADPASRDKAIKIMQEAVDYWQAQMRLGFGEHNRLYNEAVRQVRQGAVCTLFENAGHDAGKPTRYLFGDMNASCYETYTDFGNWPMSAAFTTDWAKGNFPTQPAWITTCWGTSSEGKMKDLFHAFGRGLDGGGVPMQADFGLDELARRGTGMAFCGQYGAIATRATPDARFAILATDAEQAFGDRTYYAYHALYCHLTRLGCAPVVLAEQDFVRGGGIADFRFPNADLQDNPAKGSPSSPIGNRQSAIGNPAPKVLFIVRQQQPWVPDTLKAIERFQKAGGKVVMTGDCLAKVPGAIVIPKPIKHIWEMQGFGAKSHAALWEEFDANWRQPLADALAKTGVPPLATTDLERAIVVTLDAVTMRYVVVIADSKGKHSDFFEPTEKLPVSLDGTGWTVRDLAKQVTLPTSEKDGRTEVLVDLITEPTTILALYTAPPAAVRLKAREAPRLGSSLAFSCDVLGGQDGPTFGPVPVRYTILDPSGKLRATLHRAAGEETTFHIPALDASGTWKLAAQELITGLTARLALQVAAVGGASLPRVLDPIGDVHVINSTHLSAFLRGKGEKLVIVEPNQAALLPIAKKLAEALKARLWQVRPEEFDTIPVRWYPRPEDAARLKEIEAGRLIGYRQNLVPYINKKTRSHEPERGGYAEIEPPWMVGADCVVFSGGVLAESLRAVTPWMETPNVPGRGQGRLVVCFSPFMAGRQALAVVGNDLDGIAKAAARLADASRESQIPDSKSQIRPQPPTPTTQHRWASSATASERTPVPQPYINFTPIRRFRRLLATAEGKAVAVLSGKKDTLAFVDEAGKVTGTTAAETRMLPQLRIDSQGRLWDMEFKVTATHPGWHYPTAHDIILRSIGTDGTLAGTITAYSGPTERFPPDYPGGFAVAPDGVTAAFGRPAGMLVGKLGESAWMRYDDVPATRGRDAPPTIGVRFRHEVRTPRFPVGATFSPDGRYLFFTMDTRPRFSGMGYPAFTPTSCEAILLDAATGQVVWRLREDKERRSPYAALTGFAAVAKDGAATALADFDGVVCVVDKAGKVVARDEVVIEGTKDDGRGRLGPREGVGTWIAEDGSVAAFGFKNLLLIARDGKVARLAGPALGLVPAVSSGCVAPDGSLVVVGTAKGDAKAFGPDGAPKWTAQVGGVGPFVAATKAGILVGTSEGVLLLLDANGKEVRRTNVAEAADRERHPVGGASLPRDAYPTPWDYRGPGTLALAKERLGAKQVAAWKPEGEATKAFGLTFHPTTGPIELAAQGKPGECFLHLAYRRPEGNKKLTIATEGKDDREEFLLDLPTPEWREVDIPFRGPGKATVAFDGPVEIADCSLWSFRWPGPNVAYVRPAKSSGTEIVKDEGDDLGGAATELEGDGAAPGAMKDCAIWWFNTDPDSVAGHWLKPVVDALEAVDGKRFGGGKMKPWASAVGHFAPYRGSWLTVDLKAPTKLTLVATYDRVARQSEAASNLSVFTGFDTKDSTSGVVLAGAVGSDQFWRLFALPGEPVRVLGVHAYTSDDAPSGLSEVEAYR